MVIAQGAESREDLMEAASLHDLLRDRTATEYKKRWEKSHPHPPVLSLLVFLVLAGVVSQFDKHIALIFAGIAGLFLLWLIVVMTLRASSNIPAKQEAIRNGQFPTDAAGLIMTRLRWWNHLIASHHWARHSRIFDLEHRLKRRGDELERAIKDAELDQAEAALNQNESDGEGETEEGAPLPDGIETDPIRLADRLLNMNQRVDYQQLLESIEDEYERNKAELVLVQALYKKSREVTEVLERLQHLNVDVQSFTRDELTAQVNIAVDHLEERRKLIDFVDRIQPVDRINLISI